MIGPSIPVLLTSGEEDGAKPPSSANADYGYYKAHCGCDVTETCCRTPRICSWSTSRCQAGSTTSSTGSLLAEFRGALERWRAGLRAAD